MPLASIAARAPLTFLVAVVVAHAPAWACTCQEITAADAVASGDLIAVAEIVEVRPPGGCSGGGEVQATVEVVEVIAGEGVLGTLDVQTNADEAACGVSFAEGDTWVLQVHGEDRWVSLCTASRSVSGAEDPWVVALRDAASAL